jgi:malate synthase
MDAYVALLRQQFTQSVLIESTLLFRVLSRVYSLIMDSVAVKGSVLGNKQYLSILTPDAKRFLVELHKKFNERRLWLLNQRVLRQKEIDGGKLPDFLPETAWIRQGDWKAASVPADLTDRRVEITGPVDRKMIINALNSGAKVFMADFEDSSSPTFTNMMDGQVNLRDAVNKSIYYTHANGKEYKLKKNTATLMVRPRGWHLDEAHLVVNNQPISGALFDFGLYFYHNAHNLVKAGSGPYFYLPKLESHLEAKLWNDVFVYAQDRLGIPQGTIRATVLCETILAAFEQDEIIYALRDHSAGLNCGRWDYIFSFIKKFQNHPDIILPDRAQVGMSAPWMAAYTRLLIQTCHRRGVHAMGGMAAQIPVKNNKAANDAANAKIVADKLLEVKNGHDGSWVAHPGLIQLAMDTFDAHMKTPNQIYNTGSSVPVTQADLLNLGPKGTITPGGLKANVSAGVRYLAAWLDGNGCVPLHNKMEDAATAEISRCQIWQWLKHGAVMSTGAVVSKETVQGLLYQEEAEILKELGNNHTKFVAQKYKLAFELYTKMLFAPKLDEFMTTVAYQYITSPDNKVIRSRL